MSSTLYFTRPNDPSLIQIQIALKFMGKEIAMQEINKKYDPLILLTPEGSINQPYAILQFLAEGQLAGQNEADQLRVWEWFQHFNLQLHPLLRQLYQQIGGIRAANHQKYDYSLKELLRVLEYINSHLRMRTFMVGDSVTLVDISLATHLQTVFKLAITQDHRKKIPNVVRWFNFLRSTGPLQKIMGEVTLCGKEGFTPEKKQEQTA